MSMFSRFAQRVSYRHLKQGLLSAAFQTPPLYYKIPALSTSFSEKRGMSGDSHSWCGTTAAAAIQISPAPARASRLAHLRAVEPVVSTSSTSKIRSPWSRTPRTPANDCRAFASRSRRSERVICATVFSVWPIRPSRTLIFNRLESCWASIPAGQNPRCRSLCGAGGT